MNLKSLLLSLFSLKYEIKCFENNRINKCFMFYTCIEEKSERSKGIF